jgi:spore maturation protein CgeB
MAKLVFIGLSITSSWGNGHATTYRALLKALAARAQSVTFLECDRPWYAENRDLPAPPFCETHLYRDLDELKARHSEIVREADAVIVGSFVDDGVSVGEWAVATAKGPVAFYDIDTPVTIARLERGEEQYLSLDLLRKYALYLSFTGGPLLDHIMDLGARRAAPLYCSVDPDVHAPAKTAKRWSLGYLGTHAADRQPLLEALLLAPAKKLPELRFVVAGAQYPSPTDWPANVEHVAHCPPSDHSAFYSSQIATLNLTRAEMRQAGYSPSVRLFEAAACGVPIVSDRWPGLETFFRPGREIFCAETTDEVMRILALSPAYLARVALAGRGRVLRAHTASHRAAELEKLLDASARGLPTPRSIRPARRKKEPTKMPSVKNAISAIAQSEHNIL